MTDMPDSNTAMDAVSKAWNYLREDRVNEAVNEFEKVAQQHPKDIDANYGLALSQKTAGKNEAAIRNFKNTLELVAESQKTYDATRTEDDLTNNVKTPEDDRLQMLSRMIKQRIAELESAPETA